MEQLFPRFRRFSGELKICNWKVTGFWTHLVKVKKYTFRRRDTSTEFHGAYTGGKVSDVKAGWDVYWLGLDRERAAFGSVTGRDSATLSAAGSAARSPTATSPTTPQRPINSEALEVPTSAPIGLPPSWDIPFSTPPLRPGRTPVSITPAETMAATTAWAPSINCSAGARGFRRYKHAIWGVLRSFELVAAVKRLVITRQLPTPACLYQIKS